MKIEIKDIQKLREDMGVGMMDAKEALSETGGNMEKASEYLRKKGLAKAQKRADKVAGEGVVASYIHGEGRIGALVELNCETDFVAKTDDFKKVAYELAMQIAAMDPMYAQIEDIPEEDIQKEKDVYKEQLKKEGKPDNVVDKIIEGKLEKWYEQVVLAKQTYIKDDKKTVEDLMGEAVAKMGENIKIGRFARFQIK
jgi:elongation factor Ts